MRLSEFEMGGVLFLNWLVCTCSEVVTYETCCYICSHIQHLKKIHLVHLLKGIADNHNVFSSVAG